MCCDTRFRSWPIVVAGIKQSKQHKQSAVVRQRGIENREEHKSQGTFVMQSPLSAQPLPRPNPSILPPAL